MLLSLLCAGCGYRPVGGGAPPSRLWVEPVEDRGDEPLFGALLARELTREVADRAGAHDSDRDGAEHRVTVRLDAVREAVAAYSSGDIPREYLLTAEATATLAAVGGEVLWRGSGIRASRSFAAGSGVNETEENKDRALALLAGDLSREVLRRVGLKLSGRP